MREQLLMSIERLEALIDKKIKEKGGLVETKLKEYEQLMNTYRYLGDMNVKYFMFFLIVVGFLLKAYIEAKDFAFWLSGFLVLVGTYSTFSIILVIERMNGIVAQITDISYELNIAVQDFRPFIRYLKVTSWFIFIFTIFVAVGMIFHTYIVVAN